MGLGYFLRNWGFFIDWHNNCMTILGERGLFLSWYTGGCTGMTYGSKDTHLERTSLSICGFTQSNSARKLVTETLKENDGLMCRLVFMILQLKKIFHDQHKTNCGSLCVHTMWTVCLQIMDNNKCAQCHFCQMSKYNVYYPLCSTNTAESHLFLKCELI